MAHKQLSNTNRSQADEIQSPPATYLPHYTL